MDSSSNNNDDDDDNPNAKPRVTAYTDPWSPTDLNQEFFPEPPPFIPRNANHLSSSTSSSSSTGSGSGSSAASVAENTARQVGRDDVGQPERRNYINNKNNKNYDDETRDRQPSTTPASSSTFHVETERIPQQVETRSNPNRISAPHRIDPEEYDYTVQEILGCTNTERRRQRIPDLELNSELSKAALAHANDMARNDYFSHSGTNGSTLADRVKGLTQYRYQTVAQNLFWQAPDNDPQYAVKGWMESTTGHRENLLNRDHSDVGIGYAYNPETEKHYYVQVFGSPLRTPPAPRGIEPTREVLFEVTNQARESTGKVPPMEFSPELNDSAQRHAEDIAKAKRLDALQQIDKYEANSSMFRRLAANVAHREPFNDPYSAIEGWLEKKSGRDYIMGPEMTHLGVGYAQDGDDHYYVQLYGTLYDDNRNGPGGYEDRRDDPSGGPAGGFVDGQGMFGSRDGPRGPSPDPRQGPPPPMGYPEDPRYGSPPPPPPGYGPPPPPPTQRQQQGFGGPGSAPYQFKAATTDHRRIVENEGTQNYSSHSSQRTWKVRSNRVIAQPQHHVQTGIPRADC